MLETAVVAAGFAKDRSADSLALSRQTIPSVPLVDQSRLLGVLSFDKSA